ncbi:hypothetical protein U1Q18_032483, partial [Sarracenia purpurea var. burkii]
DEETPKHLENLRARLDALFPEPSGKALGKNQGKKKSESGEKKEEEGKGDRHMHTPTLLTSTRETKREGFARRREMDFFQILAPFHLTSSSIDNRDDVAAKSSHHYATS